MSRPLLVIADDLSGAADCAAGFAPRVSTRVCLRTPEGEHGQVTAVDLDTRRLPATEAARRNRALLDNPLWSGHALYKKIDSTLRGNVVAEVTALLGRGMALVAPAFPAMARTTVGAVQLLDGVAVDRSDVWRNEGLSGSADLQALFSEQGLLCAHLSLDEVRTRHLPRQLLDHLHRGTQVLICDAERDEDLRALAQASASLAERLFWVGSAGLAQHLPEALGLPEAQRLAQPEPATPVLTVVGSMSRHSQAQATLLAERSGQGWVRIDPQVLLASDADARRAALQQQLHDVLQAGNDLLVSLEQADREPSQAAALSNALAVLLQPLLAHAGALVATGGETARALLAAAGIDALLLDGELAPGVVLSRAQHAQRTLAVVTKAGGFGQPDTLYQAWAALRPVSDPTSPHVQNNREESQHV